MCADTGSGMKDGKLKSKDFFDVKNNPHCLGDEHAAECGKSSNHGNAIS
jgi:hypothetical protein